MNSQVSFRGERTSLVRVKAEKTSYVSCTSGHLERNLWSQSVDNSSNTRQQTKNEGKIKQGNLGPSLHTKEIESILSVKQEPEEEMCPNEGHDSSTPPISSRGKRAKSQEMTTYELSDEAKLGYIKAETVECLPESEAKRESSIRPEKVATSQSSPRDPGSLFFPWQPSDKSKENFFKGKKEERKDPPYHHTSFLCFPGKPVYSHFPAPNFAQKFPGRHILEQYFGKDTKADSIRFDQRQVSQNDESLDKNEDESCRDQEHLGSGTREKSLSPTDGAEHTVCQEQDESSQLREISDSGHMSKKDEEPVWKKYQWYRERKRPSSLQIKRQNAEQPIFKKYNEIRDKRFKEGKVVADKRRLSEPWKFPEENRKACPPSSPLNIASHKAISPIDTNEPIKRRKISHDSVFPGYRNYFQDRVGGADQEISRKQHVVSRYRIDDMRLNCTDEKYYFDKDNEVQTSLPCRDEKSKNGCETTVNNDCLSSPPNPDEEELSDTVFEEKVDVRPGTLRHYPQDVAKILRLNRIVKAVRNHNTIGRKAAEKMKRSQITTNQKESQDRDEERSYSHGQEPRMDSKSHAYQTMDKWGFKNETLATADERENKNQISNGFSHSEDHQQFAKYEPKNRFEGRLEFSGLTRPFFEQKSVIKEEMKAPDDDEPVCQVNGLLSLPGLRETKFSVSLGELKRRMNPPETLTRVEMISYVRQAKSAGRILLDKNNIVTSNRSHPTILSRVCESEAKVLADGILKMNKEYLPMAFLARKTVNAYKDDGCKVDNCEDCRLKLRRRVVDVEITRNSLKELQKAIEETKKEDAFDTFELASHTFGVANILNHLSLLDEYFRLLLLTLQDE